MKTTEQKFIDEEPEGRFFAVIIGLFILLFTGVAVWCAACGITKLLEIILR